MDLKSMDCTGMKYNPNSSKSMTRLQQEYPEFVTPLNETAKYDLEPVRAKVLRYIVLLYDKESPLWHMVTDFYHRKVTALQLVGFKIQKDGKFPVEIQQGIMMGKNSVLNTMVIRYLFLFNNPKFVMLTGLLQVYFNLSLRMQESTPSKDELKMFKDTALDIEKLTSEVFGGKENKELENKLYEIMNMNKMLYRPEHIANRIVEGEELTDAQPYEEDSSQG